MKYLEWAAKLISIPFTIAMLAAIIWAWANGYIQLVLIVVIPILMVWALFDTVYNHIYRKGHSKGWDEAVEFHKGNK